MVRRFGDDAVQAARNGVDVFRDDEAFFDPHAGFLDTERVVAKRFDGPTVLLDAATLGVIDLIEYPNSAAKESPEPSGRGTWTTLDAGLLQLWHL